MSDFAKKLLNYMLYDSIPADIVKSAWSGFTYPGDVWAGRAPPDDIGRALDTAGLLTLGSFGASRAEKAAENIASRSTNMYDPPVKSARPFEADYPMRAVADDAGNLAYDIEGRPLTARYVVGRQVPGGSDQPLHPSQLAAVAEGSSGTGFEAVAPRALGRDVGRLVKDTDRRSGNNQYDILLRRDLNEAQLPRVAAHETSHLIDDLAGTIATDGLNSQLRTIYNDLNNPQGHGKKFGPEQHRYSGANINRELMAEAIRAYMADPNYIKTVAPDVAARIRAHVNANPKLQDTIQFNAGGVPTGLFDFKAPGPMTDDEFGALYRAGFAT